MSVRCKSFAKTVWVAFLVLIVFFGLFSCKKEEDPVPDVTYNVAFNTSLLPYTAEPPQTQVVKEGAHASEPTLDVTPTAGYVVIWTADLISRTPYVFSASVNKDLLLYAVEVPRPYKVNYLFKNGIGAPNPKNITEFTKVTPTFKLLAPILKNDIDENGVGQEEYGYRFYYWSDAEREGTMVTELPPQDEEMQNRDIFLRAVIKAREFTVQYMEDGEVNPNPKTYLFGDTVSLKTPLKEGYVFKGYTIYSEGTRTPVTELTPEFVRQHAKALTRPNGRDIFLLTNWEEVS